MKDDKTITTDKTYLIKKGCPFCGSNPHTRQLKQQSCQLHGEPYQDWMVCCPKGHAQVKAPTKELALEQWNDRHEGI